MHKHIDNLITFRNSQDSVVRGTLLKVSKSTIVFEVYNPYSVVQLSEVLQELSIFNNDHEVIYNGRGVVSNLMNTGLMLVVSATLIDPWPDLTPFFDEEKTLTEESNQFVDEWSEAHNLRPGYELAVGKLRSFFSELSRWLEQLDLITPESSDSPTSEEELLKQIEEPLLEKVALLFEAFENEAKHVPDKHLPIHKNFAQRDLHPLLMISPFSHRTFSKPMGYAGDYEMVNMILRNPHEGPTLYAKLINAISLLAPPPTAHRNRIDILIELLGEVAERCDGPIKVLNIGCGPAGEIQRFLRHHPEADRFQFHLLDFNEETISYTRNTLERIIEETGRKTTLEFTRNSVHDLLKTAAKRDALSGANQFDLVYCAGLFDYLSDKICAKLIRLFYRYAKPGGDVMLTNVHSCNPNLYWMEHVLEWHLIYRDEQKMEHLVPDLGQQTIFTDDTGVNIFLRIKKDTE